MRQAPCVALSGAVRQRLGQARTMPVPAARPGTLAVASCTRRGRSERVSLCLVQSRALVGLEAAAVTVEVHLGNGLPQFTLVGLADTEVKEARP